jgi:hypothetical protein
MAHEDETSGLCVADADVGRGASKGSGQGVSGTSRQRACNMEINKSQRTGWLSLPGSSKRIAGSDRRELK